MLNSYETQRAGKTNNGHRFAAKKNVSVVVIRLWLTVLSYTYGYSKQFPYAKPWLLTRETTLQHDMARKIRFQFLLVEGWNF